MSSCYENSRQSDLCYLMVSAIGEHSGYDVDDAGHYSNDA